MNLILHDLLIADLLIVDNYNRLCDKSFWSSLQHSSLSAIYFMMSFAVRNFSASTSGISNANSSSTAIMTSTWSRESNPRSVWKSASSVNCNQEEAISKSIKTSSNEPSNCRLYRRVQRVASLSLPRNHRSGALCGQMTSFGSWMDSGERTAWGYDRETSWMDWEKEATGLQEGKQTRRGS